MKLSEIFKIADELAPKALSDELCAKYGMYDNSGVLVDTNDEIRGMVCSLDLSEGAIDRAIACEANLILTHHPAIYGKISHIDYQDGLLGKKLVRCIKNGISVLSMHLNLDAAEGGIDECLMEGILRSAKQTMGAGARSVVTQMPVTGGAYGRVYEIGACNLQEIAAGMKEVFSTRRIEVYGEDRKVNKVASFCGAGADESSVGFAVANGAEVFISSDFKHHVLAMALELGLSVIALPHYASENYGFKKYYEKISQRVEIPCVYHEDNNLL